MNKIQIGEFPPPEPLLQKGDILFCPEDKSYYILGYCNDGYVPISLLSGQYWCKPDEDPGRVCGSRLKLFRRNATITIS
jgi:hypothetical protein